MIERTSEKICASSKEHECVDDSRADRSRLSAACQAWASARVLAAAKRAQQKVCSKRHAERVKAARMLMRAQSKLLDAAVSLEEADGVRRTCSLADFSAQAL
jgi:hypothetical protein